MPTAFSEDGERVEIRPTAFSWSSELSLKTGELQVCQWRGDMEKIREHYQIIYCH